VVIGDVVDWSEYVDDCCVAVVARSRGLDTPGILASSEVNRILIGHATSFQIIIHVSLKVNLLLL
jgi:hypothetical protein